ncbi:bile acid:sodium symporter [Pseudoxanthomonas kalamensis DSM 18571]|uniref:bile acid:sodium symporter family protein n=1 Tax=Pseudoxanthomonas kalamensis TaxID=289483 RepID=UPI00139142D2|nr:bile acid:sodium symporter family protein [Pseudoxanthomonas kalamensis]KAF1712606.1 bile acid:sodium symporter [Pseudoxanthomonas kalamensis DSM 18571]
MNDAAVSGLLDDPWVMTALPLINILIMFGIGMTLRAGDFRKVMRYPGAVGVGMAGQYLLLPAIGFMIAALFTNTPAYAVGFVLLAACPSASSSNVLTYLSRGNVALSVTLTVVCSVVTLISIPLLVNLALHWRGAQMQTVHLPIMNTMGSLTMIVLLPILAGMLARRYAPAFVSRVEKWVGLVSFLLLLGLIALITWAQIELVQSTILRLGPAALVMCMAGLAGGWALARMARLDAADSTTIAIEVGVQNCALAIVVALSVLRMPQAALPAGIYGLLMYLPALAGVAITRRRRKTALSLS